MINRIYKLIHSSHFKITVVVILFFYLFLKLDLKLFFDKYLVKYFFKFLTIDNTIELCFFIFLIFSIIFIFFYKSLYLKAKPSSKRTLVFLIFLTFYSILRSDYILSTFIFNISISDALFGTLLTGYLLQWCSYFYASLKKKTASCEKKFLKDSIFEDNSKITLIKEDKIGRIKFANELSTYILNTGGEGSLNIGIEGPWGSGKTYMLNLIKKRIKNQAIIVEFNPWQSHDSKNIVKDFFMTLSSKLKNFDQGIQDDLKKYLQLIINSINYNFGLISFTPNVDIECQQDILDNQIKSLNKPLIIFIDDIDRLHKEEIFEVLKLIRNTANFTNTVFVVAFDYDYLYEVLINSNIKNTNYIEKIFQFIFPLPTFDNDKLVNELKILVISNSTIIKNSYADYFEQILKVFKNIILDNITNMRDVIRFSNQLCFNIEFLKNDIDFRDFVLFELLKFKDLNLIKEIYNKRYEFLNEKNGLYILTDEEKLLNQLFSNSKNKKSNKELLSNLFAGTHRRLNSINKINNFYKYFSLAIFSNDLTNEEFIDAFLISKTGILAIVNGWLEKSIDKRKIIDKIENYKYSEILDSNLLKSKKILTKVISAAKYTVFNIAFENKSVELLHKILVRIFSEFKDRLPTADYEEAFSTGFFESEYGREEFHFIQRYKNFNFDNSPEKEISIFGISQRKIHRYVYKLYEDVILNISDINPLDLFVSFVSTISSNNHKFDKNLALLTRNTLLTPRLYQNFVYNSIEIGAHLKVELEKYQIPTVPFETILKHIFPLDVRDNSILILNLKSWYEILKKQEVEPEKTFEITKGGLSILFQINSKKQDIIKRISNQMVGSVIDDYDRKFMDIVKNSY